MRAESLLPEWVVLLLAGMLLSTGCAPRMVSPPSTGGTPALRPHVSAASAWRRTASGMEDLDAEAATPFPATSDDDRLLRRRTTVNEQGSSVHGARPVETGRDPFLPPGWPHLRSSEDVLAPFLACTSPAAFVELQHGADMPGLVAALDDWSAVRLGALGPLDAGASEVLQRKRASFLVAATEMYGVARAEVFALFILHSAFDDELRRLFQLLARNKQLDETLGGMSAVREELRRRGLTLAEYPDRPERAADVLRGLGRAGRDALSSTPVGDGARYQDFTAKRGQLPPPYQRALDEVEKLLMERHFAPDSVAVGSLDHLTFGVPLGFYHLVSGTGQGASSLAHGRYEQATRELAPAGLLVALYAGGKGGRYVAEGAGTARRGARRLQLPALDLAGLKSVVDRLSERLGESGIRDVFQYLQAQREAGLLVAEWGELGAVALHEARGSVPKAQAWLSEARAQPGGAASTPSAVTRRSGGTSEWGHEAAGFMREALEAKLLQTELEAPGPRLPRDVSQLRALRPRMDSPPWGVREGAALWGEYVKYRERRLAEIERGASVEGPLRWEGYQQMRGLFARGVEFERLMVSRLRADAVLPRAQRHWLRDFEAPRIETHVGVAKRGVAGIRYADVLVIEERPPPGQPPRVETFSFKSRDLAPLKDRELDAQMKADAGDALRYYAETLNIRRPELKLEVHVQRTRLIYEGGALRPRNARIEERAVREAQDEAPGVEVLFQ